MPFIMQLHSVILEKASFRGALVSALGLLVAYFLFYFRREDPTIPGFEVVGKEKGELSNANARARFRKNGRKLLADALDRVEKIEF